MSSFYRDLHTNCSNEFLKKFPHYIVPNLKVHSEVDLQTKSYSPYNYTKPIPFLPPASVPVEVWAGSDPATDLLRKKLQWKTELDVQKRYYTRTKKKTALCTSLEAIISSERNVWTASPRDSYFMELVASDPDKEFDGTYSWYYTGGCLDTLQMNNKHMLLTTQGHKNDQLRVIQLKKMKFWKPSLASTTTTQLCTPEQPIYQIRGSRDTGYLCVRQHKQSHLYLLTEELELQCIHSTECDSAFTGIDLSPHTTGSYVTVTSRRHVKEWDACGRNTYTHRVCLDKTLQDKWCSVSYSDNPHCLVLADRNSVYILDKRNKKSHEKHSLRDEVQLVGVCEDISLVFHSCINTHALYICSSHSILLYDTRSFMKPIQSWKHNLCSPPLLSCTVSPQQNEEVICIANQDPGEMVTVVNKWNGEVPNFQTYLQGMPSLQDTLLAANNSGLWLNPTVQHRAKLSLTGLVSLPPIASEFTLLSQTSAGDVFSIKQKTHNGLKSAISFTNQSELECLTKWEKMLLEKRTSAALKITSRKSMKNSYEYMKSSRNRLPQCEILQKSKHQAWELSKAQLEGYVDLLAPRILEVWEIEDLPEWGENGRNSLRAQLFPEHVDKVEAWLTSIPDSRYVKQEKKRKTSRNNIPMLTSTPYEHKHKKMLGENTCFSKIEEKFNEISEFDLTVSQNKKLKTALKHEFISGF